MKQNTMIALMIQEELDETFFPEGDRPLIDADDLLFPEIEDEYPLFEELERGIA